MNKPIWAALVKCNISYKNHVKYCVFESINYHYKYYYDYKELIMRFFPSILNKRGFLGWLLSFSRLCANNLKVYIKIIFCNIHPWIKMTNAIEEFLIYTYNKY